uniref:Uncharacterized protein n=1 Tax=Octopus bimaculoides TaxID=37653 RepID=A0A0L8GJT8_OCTBM
MVFIQLHVFVYLWWKPFINTKTKAMSDQYISSEGFFMFTIKFYFIFIFVFGVCLIADVFNNNKVSFSQNQMLLLKSVFKVYSFQGSLCISAYMYSNICTSTYLNINLCLCIGTKMHTIYTYMNKM